MSRLLLMVLGVLATVAPRGAGAQTRLQVTPSLSLGGGWSSNLYLDTWLTGDPTPASDALVEVRSRVMARAIHGRLVLTALYDLVDRNTLTLGTVILDHLALVRAELGLGAARIGLTLHGQRWDPLCGAADASCGAGDTFQRLGVEVGVQIGRGSIAAGGSWRFDLRHYPDPARTLADGSRQLDREQRAQLWLDLDLDTVVVDARLGWLHVGSPNPMAELDRLRLSLALRAQPRAAPRLAFDAGYALAGQYVPAADDNMGGTAPRLDGIHEVWASLRVRLWRTVHAFAEADVLVATSDMASGRYTRVMALGGLQGSFELGTTVRGRETLGPTNDGDRVLFRARAPGARRVAIVGDWNGWDPAAAPLVAVGDGTFRAALAVPPGRHAYSLWIDGRIASPPDAPAYAPDGFGGRNGIIVVGASGGIEQPGGPR